jgi:hypothetical protein
MKTQKRKMNKNALRYRSVQKNSNLDKVKLSAFPGR